MFCKQSAEKEMTDEVPTLLAISFSYSSKHQISDIAA